MPALWEDVPEAKSAHSARSDTHRCEVRSLGDGWCGLRERRWALEPSRPGLDPWLSPFAV